MKTKTLKTSELAGKPLDYIVFTLAYPHLHKNVFDGQYMNYRYYDNTYQFSTQWADGGPIIERTYINVNVQRDEHGWKVSPTHRWYAQQDHRVYTAYGPTPLIAAMRCYVASKLGDVVSVPVDILE